MTWQSIAKRVSALERHRARWRHVFILNWRRDPEGAAAAYAAYQDARARGVTGIVFIQFGSGRSKVTRVR